MSLLLKRSGNAQLRNKYLERNINWSHRQDQACEATHRKYEDEADCPQHWSFKGH